MHLNITISYHGLLLKKIFLRKPVLLIQSIPNRNRDTTPDRARSNSQQTTNKRPANDQQTTSEQLANRATEPEFTDENRIQTGACQPRFGSV